MILARYILRRFLQALALVYAALGTVIFMAEAIEAGSRYADKDASAAQILWLAALRLPEQIYAIQPILVTLSGAALFLGLARNSELVVLRAAGQSARQILIAPMLGALAFGAAVVALGNPLVAAAIRAEAAVVAQIETGVGQIEEISVGREGLWLRQSARPIRDSVSGAGGGSGGLAVGTQMVIHAMRADSSATTLYDATFILFDEAGGLTRRIGASAARLEDGVWALSEVKIWPMDGSSNPERDAVAQGALTLPTDLTPEKIRDGVGTPAALPIWQLPAYIVELEEAGFSARRHKVWLQMELSLPPLLAAMVLVAAGFTMRHARFGGTGQMVLLTFVSGLGVFFLRNIAQVMGESGRLPVALAAWAPPVIALMLALALVLHKEDG